MRTRPVTVPHRTDDSLWRAAWQRGDFSGSISLLQRASRESPGNGSLLLELGRRLGLRRRYPEAERCLAQAISASGRGSDAVLQVVRACRGFGDYDMAQRFLERALAAAPGAPDLLVDMAALCERKGRLDEAAEFAARALRLSQSLPAALLVEARLDRRHAELERAEAKLRALTLRTDVDSGFRAQTAYELSAVLDQVGEYDAAMTALLEAKAILRPLTGRWGSGIGVGQMRVELAVSELSSEAMRRWADMAPALRPTRPIAFLGGHPRSGTTLLEQLLDAHPDIVSLEETKIFHEESYGPLCRAAADGELMSSVLDSASTANLRRARQAYFTAADAQLREGIADRLLVDKNPALTALVPALVRVFPETRLLIALRDPRDVCLSCFMQPFVPSPGNTAFMSLEETVQNYVSMMGSYRVVAPLLPVPLLEVRYEDIVADLESVSRRVLDFLGVPWDSRVLRYDEHARQKVVQSPTYADVVKPIYTRSLGRWRRYERYLEPYLEQLAPLAVALGYDRR